MNKEKQKPDRASKGPKKAGKLSLHPLSLEEALKGAMGTGPPPESPRAKKRKPEKNESAKDP